MPTNSNDFALVMGIKDYPKYRSLNNPIDDANAFEEWLLDEEGGGLEGSHCKKVLSIAEPPQPNPYEIDDKLEEILELTKDKEARRFYLYFSGHGLGIEPDDNGLCLTSWAYQRMGLALSSREYLNFLINSGRFKEIFMFLDCCRINLIQKQYHNPTLSNPGPGDGAGQSKKFIAFATEYTMAAFEPSRNGNLDPYDIGAKANGFFTKALLSGLKGAARNERGEVTLHNLAEHIDVDTSRLAAEAGHHQTARFTNDFLQRQSPILAVIEEKSSKLTLSVTFSCEGDFRLENGRLEVVERENVSPGSVWELELDHGLYMLINKSTGDERPIRVSPSKERLDVTV